MEELVTRRFTFLHLSDFHFECEGSNSSDLDLVLDSLLDNIDITMKEKAWEPELILCTGDIAYSGKTKEYENAAKFLDKLLEATKLAKKHLIVVPGNHDVDVDLVDNADKLLQQNTKYSSHKELDDVLHTCNYDEFLSITKKLFDNKLAIGALLAKFQGYITFYRTYLQRPLDENRPILYEVIQSKSGIKIGIIALNSAWLHLGRGNSIEYGHQLIPMHSLYKSISELKKSGSNDLIIAMYHHPIEWLYEKQRGPIRVALSEYADIMLEGHQDETQTQFFYDTINKKALQLQIGPAYKESHYPNKIQFVRYEISNQHKSVEVKPLCYEKVSRRWIADTATYAHVNPKREDGHGYFPLWQAPSPRKELKERYIKYWDEFYSACHKFEEGRNYILVIGDTSQSSAQKKMLGRVNWNLVLEFYEYAEEHGVYAAIKDEMSVSRGLHLLTFEDKMAFSAECSTYWVAAFGLPQRPTTIVKDDWRSWNRQYNLALQDYLKRFSVEGGEYPYTIVILWHKPEYIHAICTAIDSFFGGSADFVFATSQIKQVESIAKAYDSEVIPIILSSI